MEFNEVEKGRRMLPRASSNEYSYIIKSISFLWNPKLGSVRIVDR